MSTYGVRLRRSDDLSLPAHPGGCSADGASDWASQQCAAGRPLAVDLFSGAGGLSLGLEDAGWTVAAAVDSDAKSVATHRHNFPGLALQSDLGEPHERRKLVSTLRSLGEIDLVAGGPPCQPFSRAGRSKIRDLVAKGARDADDDRRQLWKAFVNVVVRIKPRAVLMENVPDMALGDEFRAVRLIMQMLRNAGYFTELRLIDAWRYGVPQHRKRLILLARRDVDAFPWPEPLAEVDLRQAIGDLPPLDGDIGARSTTYTGPEKPNSYLDHMRAGAYEGIVHDHMTRPVREDDRQIFEMMTSKTLYSDLPSHLQRYRTDTFTDKYKRLAWDDLSRSITAHIARDGYWYIHPDQPRTLTVREAARIQTFPDRFRFAGTRSDAFRQIGNAVPPALGAAAARTLLPEPGTGAREPHQRSRATKTRVALLAWARTQRSDEFWYSLPGPSVTIPVAAAAAILTVNVHDARVVERALSTIRGKHHIDLDDVLNLEMTLPTLAARRAVRKLEVVAANGTSAWRESTDVIAKQLKLSVAQTDVFMMLCNQDVLLDNQSAIRVAARVAGRPSDTINRLTDGRTDVARLIGADEKTPLCMAALRLLGRTICRDNQRKCDECPLRRTCIDASTSGPTVSDLVPS